MTRRTREGANARAKGLSARAGKKRGREKKRAKKTSAQGRCRSVTRRPLGRMHVRPSGAAGGGFGFSRATGARTGGWGGPARSARDARGVDRAGGRSRRPLAPRAARRASRRARFSRAAYLVDRERLHARGRLVVREDRLGEPAARSATTPGRTAPFAVAVTAAPVVVPAAPAIVVPAAPAVVVAIGPALGAPAATAAAVAVAAAAAAVAEVRREVRHGGSRSSRGPCVRPKRCREGGPGAWRASK